MTCAECKANRTPETIPYIAHEGEVTRLERIIKRLTAIIILLIVLLVGTNVGWMYYESQFEDVEITQKNADGYNNFIGNDGDIVNGYSDDKNPQT